MVCASSAWPERRTLASAAATDAVSATTATDTLVETNPYLAGPYAPIHTEIDATDLEVIGEIPRDLDGVYLRNGPNPQFPPTGRPHWFDGDGMVHAVQFRDGKATYRNRWVRTDAFDRER